MKLSASSLVFQVAWRMCSKDLALQFYSEPMLNKNKLLKISLVPLISSFNQPRCFCYWRTAFVVWGRKAKSL